MNLEKLIKNKKAKVAVIGLGYVGLPVALELAKTGYQVFGIDIKKERVQKANKGVSYIADVSSSELKRVIESKKLKAFSNHLLLKNSDIILICVPTPLDKNKNPDLSYIESTTEEGTIPTKNKKIFMAKLPPVNEDQLNSGLEKLKEAAEIGDKETILKTLKELIPNYGKKI